MVPRLTERVKVESGVDALLDSLVGILSRVHLRRFNSQRVEPNPHGTAVKTPKRVFQGTDAVKMRPVGFDLVCQDLHVISHFFVAGLHVRSTLVLVKSKMLTLRGRSKISLPSTRKMMVAMIKSSAGSPWSTS